MSCAACEDVGVVPFVAHDNPKPDDAIGTEDLLYALCLCPAGRWFRSDENAGQKTGYYGWQVWAAQHGVNPSRIHRVEDVYSAEDLAAVGLSRQPGSLSREAALLTAAKARRAKL